MDTQQAAGFLRRVADLEYLGQFPETVAGLKEVAEMLVGPPLSPLAQSILEVITVNTRSPKGSYIAGWTICDKLNISRIELDCSLTAHDKALKELIDAGLVEELPDLGCRYRLCNPTSCPPVVQAMLDDPEWEARQPID